MRLPWKTILAILLALAAFALTSVNTLVVGGFVGRALTVHPDLESQKGRGAVRTTLLCNGTLAFVFLVALVLFAGRFGWKTYGSYASSKGCDLSGNEVPLGA